MFLEKIKQVVGGTFRLLCQFKWYVLIYMICYIIYILALLDPPAVDDRIFFAEETSLNWVYTNQQVYIGSLKLEIIILSLIFLLATSNMRNHPLLAKVFFFSSFGLFLL